MMVVVMLVIFKSLMKFGQGGVNVLYRRHPVATEVVRALVQRLLCMLQFVNRAMISGCLSRCIFACAQGAAIRLSAKTAVTAAPVSLFMVFFFIKKFVHREMLRTGQLYDSSTDCQKSKGIMHRAIFHHRVMAIFQQAQLLPVFGIAPACYRPGLKAAAHCRFRPQEKISTTGS